MPDQIPVSEAVDHVLDQLKKDDLRLTSLSDKMIVSIIEGVYRDLRKVEDETFDIKSTIEAIKAQRNEEYFIYKTFLEWLSTEYFKI